MGQATSTMERPGQPVTGEWRGPDGEAPRPRPGAARAATIQLERSAVPQREAAQRGLGWRLILAVIGFGIAMTGWALVLTVFLSFIGLPLFIFGLALMQSQERRA